MSTRKLLPIWKILSFKMDMYNEGTLELTEMILQLILCPPDQREETESKTITCLPLRVYVGSLKSGDLEFQGQEKGRGWETKATAPLAFTSRNLL